MLVYITLLMDWSWRKNSWQNSNVITLEKLKSFFMHISCNYKDQRVFVDQYKYLNLMISNITLVFIKSTSNWLDVWYI